MLNKMFNALIFCFATTHVLSLPTSTYMSKSSASNDDSIGIVTASLISVEYQTTTTANEVAHASVSLLKLNNETIDKQTTTKDIKSLKVSPPTRTEKQEVINTSTENQLSEFPSSYTEMENTHNLSLKPTEPNVLVIKDTTIRESPTLVSTISKIEKMSNYQINSTKPKINFDEKFQTPESTASVSQTNEIEKTPISKKLSSNTKELKINTAYALRNTESSKFGSTETNNISNPVQVFESSESTNFVSTKSVSTLSERKEDSSDLNTIQVSKSISSERLKHQVTTVSNLLDKSLFINQNINVSSNNQKNQTAENQVFSPQLEVNIANIQTTVSAYLHKPSNQEKNFSFLHKDNLEIHQDINENYFKDSDWTDIDTHTLTNETGEMFEDPCAYLAHRVNNVLSINVSKLTIKQFIKDLNLGDFEDIQVQSLNSTLQMCITDYEKNNNFITPACKEFTNAIEMVCKEIDGCLLEEAMKNSINHLKHLISTESLHDALVMMRACAEQTYHLDDKGE